MPTLTSVARNAMVDAVAALLNSGKIRFLTSGDVTVAECNFASTAFEAAAAGVASANDITDDTDAVGGTVAKVHLLQDDGTEVMEASAGESGSGADFIMSNEVIGSGDTVRVTSCSLTQPAS